MHNQPHVRWTVIPCLGLMLACLWPAGNARAAGNDNFANAWLVSALPYSTNSSNADATQESGEPPHHGSTNRHSVWWRWTAPESGPVQVNTTNSSFRSALGVYTGPAVNNLTKVASGRGNHLLNFIATSGTSYHIALDSIDAKGWGNFTFRMIPGLTPPANDQFANAAPLNGATVTVTSATNSGATAEAGEPLHAGINGGKSLWWKWAAPISGTFQLDTADSTVDTLLAVYTGTAFSALTPIASNDNSGRMTSLLTFSAAAGTTYHFAVDGWEGNEGQITLHLLPLTPQVQDLAFANLGLVLSNSQLHLRFHITGPSGSNVVVQTSTNLSQTSWASVQTNVLTGGSVLFADPAPATQPAKFYRAVLR